MRQKRTNTPTRANASASTSSDACTGSFDHHDADASAVLLDIFDDSIDIAYDFFHDISRCDEIRFDEN